MTISFAASTFPRSLRLAQRGGVDKQRPRGHLLDVHDRANLARDLLLYVVALVEHEGHVTLLTEAATT